MVQQGFYVLIWHLDAVNTKVGKWVKEDVG
jgi:hypothetical protein